MERKAFIALVTTVLLLLTSTLTAVMQTASAQSTIKVGVLVPYKLIQGDAYTGGAEGGAILAANDINAAGGINIGGTKYLIELVKDPATGKLYDEWAYPLNPTQAYYNTKALIAAGCKFIIGGFRTECTWQIMKAIAEHNSGVDPKDWVIYLINGASTDELCIESKCKEMTGIDMSFAWRFRMNPINSTMLFMTVLGWLKGYLIPYKLKPMWGEPVRFACIAEDLEWTEKICWYFANVGLGPGTQFVGCARTPDGTSDFTSYLNAFKAAGAVLVCHFYTLPDAKHLVMQWYEGKYKFLLVGIDVFGQSAIWPIWTEGKCIYEMTEDFSGTRTPLTPLAVKFWDNFVGNFSVPGAPPAWPVYTAWGAYNAFLSMKAALEAAGTLDSTKIIEAFEGQEIWVLNGKAKFTPTHDIYTLSYGPTWPDKYTRAVYVQWQKPFVAPSPPNVVMGLIKQVVCPIFESLAPPAPPVYLAFPRKVAIPPWIYPVGDTDLNLDGTVDIFDAVILADAAGSSPGHPKWNIEADITRDGLVDIFDAVRLAGDAGYLQEPWPMNPFDP